MPILSIFPGSSGTGGRGTALGAVDNINIIAPHSKAYFKWTDPEDVIVDGVTLATYAGTLLVRKAGSVPINREDGVIILDSKTRNAYQNTYFCDSGLTDGVKYYYNFFPYTTDGVYTNAPENLVEVTPNSVAPQDVSDMSLEAAGNAKVVLKWTDPEDTIQDGIPVVVWGGSKVVYKKDSAPTSEADGTLVINSTTKDAYKTTGLTIDGLENGETYYIGVFPYGSEAYGSAINTNEVNIKRIVSVLYIIDTVPTQEGTLTYNGSVQSPTWANYDSTKMRLDIVAQVNAGTYTATFTPLEDCAWSDGTREGKVIEWVINKAIPRITLSKNVITLNEDTLSDTFTFTHRSDGNVSLFMSESGIVSASISGDTITVESINKTKGRTTVGITLSETINYRKGSKGAVIDCEFLPPVGTPLNDFTWEEISTISTDGNANSYFSVGDCKEVEINGTVGSLTISGTYSCFIIGINHNGSTEVLPNNIHFQFGKTALTGGIDICFNDSGHGSQQTSGTWFNMNNVAKNTGGWESSQMRNNICPAFKEALPTDLQSRMRRPFKYTDNTGGGSDTASNVTYTRDWIFLLAEYEVFGVRTSANSAEQNYQQQYDYYANGNSKVKYKYNDTATVSAWWLRSVPSGTSLYFCLVDGAGSLTRSPSSRSYGFAPAFCV